VYSSVWQIPICAIKCLHTVESQGEKNTRVKNVNSDFMSPGGSDFNFLKLQGFARSPANGGFTLDGFSSGVRHGDGSGTREKGCEKMVFTNVRIYLQLL